MAAESEGRGEGPKRNPSKKRNLKRVNEVNCILREYAKKDPEERRKMLPDLRAKIGMAQFKEALGAVKPPKDPLYFAIRNGLPEIVKLLAKRFDISRRDYYAISLECNQPEIAEIILDAGAVKNKESLADALLHGKMEHAEKIMEKNPESIAQKGEIYKQTPLMVALQSGNAEAAKKLIEKGADVLAQDRNGWTALNYSAGKPELNEVTKMLVERGVLKVHERSSKVPEKSAHISFHPIAIALEGENANEHIARHLLKKNMVFDSRDKNGECLLTHLLSDGRWQGAEMVLEKYKNASKVLSCGRNVLHEIVDFWSSPKNRAGAVKRYYHMGRKPNEEEVKRLFPEMQERLVKLALKKRVSPLQPDAKGRSAIESAKQNGLFKIAKMMERHAEKMGLANEAKKKEKMFSAVGRPKKEPAGNGRVIIAPRKTPPRK